MRKSGLPENQAPSIPDDFNVASAECSSVAGPISSNISLFILHCPARGKGEAQNKIKKFLIFGAHHWAGNGLGTGLLGGAPFVPPLLWLGLVAITVWSLSIIYS